MTRGMILGAYQGQVLGGTPCSLILFATGHPFIALILLAATLVALVGWWKHFNFAWSVND